MFLISLLTCDHTSILTDIIIHPILIASELSLSDSALNLSPIELLYKSPILELSHNH